MLATRATTPQGYAIKLRQIERELEGQGMGSPWLESLRRDLEAIA